jgi:hypothetical protein
MRSNGEIVGVILQRDSPNWAPLIAAVGEEVTAGFMWMFEVATSDERRLHAYKHIVTRRYVHLDEDGNAFYFADIDDHTYRPIALDRILDAVLSPWWKDDLSGGPAGAMAAAKRAVRRARAQARRATAGSS